ncbi:hypothetical protein [Comamonas sp. NLF-1-9]|uniref:hypothetical protein n=1 Tax=Comamonas sp. NLF-1-9 TaxID=2853163 RepID=UPI001C494062|nr:hypothetical protein [Comamonas sp. NLF-1-9]QXL83243.1 hypothetical protein KUD94_08140 [Comamonas sp. NLF-1-9]
MPMPVPAPAAASAACASDHEAWFGAQRERALAWRMLGLRVDARNLVQSAQAARRALAGCLR